MSVGRVERTRPFFVWRLHGGIPTDKLIIVGQVTGNREVAELSELDAYLTDGWHIKEIQAKSTDENCCCYVWLTRKNK